MTESERDGDSEFDRIVHKYYQAIENGQSVDPQRFIDSHPEFQAELKSFFADVENLGQAAGDAALAGTVGPNEARQQDATLKEIGPGQLFSYVGEYRILEEIARGGMGVVFKARQEKLKRTVALKMILSGRFASDADVDRFRREARAAAALQHPNIVGVHEVGEHRGHHYFTMDYVEGESLAGFLHKETLVPRAAAELLTALCRAVDYAHRKGVLHRDLKPSNVLIDSDEQPHVTDFGLAKPLVDDADGTIDDLTRSGQILGTPSYMSPEQAAAKHQLISVATDVYSLGAILYACLCGRAPFTGKSTVETLHKVVGEEPVPVRQLNPKVPKDLETICLKCLRKEPHLRYGTAGELADDLRRFLDGRTVTARPVRVWGKTLRWSKRNPWTAATLALIFAICIGGPLAALEWANLRSSADASAEIATAETIRADREAEVADEIAEEADRHRGNAESNRYLSLLREAQAIRESHVAGYKELAWARLAEAARLETPAVDHRQLADEATASLGDWVGLMPFVVEGPALEGERAYEIAGFLDDETIAVVLADQSVSIRDLSTGNEKSRITRARPRVFALYGIKQGQSLLLFVGGYVQRWDNKNDSWVLKWTTPIRVMHKNRIAVFANDTRIAIGTTAGVDIISCEDGQITDRLRTPRVVAVTACESGKYIACADDKSKVVVWDARSKKVVREMDSSGESISAIAFSADERFLVTGSDSGFRTYKADDFERWSVCRTNPIRSLSPSPNGTHVMLQTQAGALELWNIATQQLDADLSNPAVNEAGIGTMGYSPSGLRFMASASNKFRIWRTDGAPEKRTLKGHTHAVRHLAFRENVPQLLSATRDGSLIIWDTNSGTILHTFDVDATLNSFDLSNDGELIATASDSGLQIWHPENPANIQLLSTLAGSFQNVRFSPDGKWLATRSLPLSNGTQVWRINYDPGESQVKIASKPLEGLKTLRGARFVFDSSSRFLGTDGGFFDLESESWHHYPRPRQDGRKPLFRSNLDRHPSKAVILGVGIHGNIQIWNLESKRVIRLIAEEPTLSSSHLAANPNGESVAVDIEPDIAGVFDYSTGERRFRLGREHASIVALKWNRDGRKLAIGLADGTISVWDMAEVANRLRKHGLMGGLVSTDRESPPDPRTEPEPQQRSPKKWSIAPEQAQVSSLLWSFGVHDSQRKPDSENRISISKEGREAIESAGGAVSASGAFVVDLPAKNFLGVSAHLVNSGLRIQSLRPFWNDGQLSVSACWIRGEQRTLSRIGMTRSEVASFQEKMQAPGFRIIDFGGYFANPADQSSERFYAVFSKTGSEPIKQFLNVGISRVKMETMRDQLMKTHQPMVRKAYFTPEKEIRVCELWNEVSGSIERRTSLWLSESPLVYSQIKGSQLTVTHCDIASSHDGQQNVFSAVSSDPAAKLRLREMHGISVPVLKSVGKQLLTHGYQPMVISVAASQQEKTKGVAIWSSPTETRRGAQSGANSQSRSIGSENPGRQPNGSEYIESRQSPVQTGGELNRQAGSARLIEPKENALLSQRNRAEWRFDWEDVPGAIAYEIFIIGPNATIPLADQRVKESKLVVPRTRGYVIARNLKNWKWRVRAVHPKNKFGPWSPERKFNVAPQ